jgi:hypothetical protein
VRAVLSAAYVVRWRTYHFGRMEEVPRRWFLVVRDGNCPECRLEAATVEEANLGEAIFEESLRWSELLTSRAGSPALVGRPLASVWSPLEYGRHVRDVLVLFAERIRLAVATEKPTFEYQDQNEAIVEGRYNEADPSVVAQDILVEVRDFHLLLDTVPGDNWRRYGTHNDDERFDVSLLARFALHEIRHHRVDAERLLQG